METARPRLGEIYTAESNEARCLLLALSGRKFECAMYAFAVAIGGKADMPLTVDDVR